MSRRMNRDAMLRALSDAETAIEGMRREIAAGEHDDDGPVAFSIPFQYILWQLCIAWHSRWLTDSELDQMTEEDDDLMRNSIPNWGLSFTLVDIDEPERFNPPDAPV